MMRRPIRERRPSFRDTRLTRAQFHFICCDDYSGLERPEQYLGSISPETAGNVYQLAPANHTDSSGTAVFHCHSGRLHGIRSYRRASFLPESEIRAESGKSNLAFFIRPHLIPIAHERKGIFTGSQLSLLLPLPCPEILVAVTEKDSYIT